MGVTTPATRTNPAAEVVLHPVEYRTGELRYPMGPAKQ